MYQLHTQKLNELFGRYERIAFSATMLAGFIVDNLTLTRIDLLFDNVVLFFYLAVAILGVAITNLYDAGVWRGSPDGARFFRHVPSYARTLSPFLMQYAFGGLLSGFFVFYARGASSAAVGWPFLGLLLFLLVGNEFFRTRYQRLTFQVSILFFVLYSYMIFFVPIVVGAMGVWVFLLSGAVSICTIGAILYGFSYIMRAQVYEARRAITTSVGALFLAMHVFYFLNIIPPLPLSLKEAGVYYSVTRGPEGVYVGTEEEQRPWYAMLMPHTRVRNMSGGPLYFYSAVFAPTRLSETHIVHHWQYFDEQAGEWITRLRVPFPIVGGRDGGYRGYSLKTNVEPGLWRVRVETTRGQVLGQARFQVEQVSTLPPLAEKVL